MPVAVLVVVLLIVVDTAGFVILFIDKLQNVFLPKEIEIENISYN
jgi:hypothetical protein